MAEISSVMLVSHQHRFIFVHICKTAGSSIQRALSPFADEMPRDRLSKLRSKLGLVRGGPGIYYPIHADCRYAQTRLGRESYNRMFKFAFVRNPWDLLVSSFHYIKSNPQHHRHDTVCALGGFEAFIDYEARRGKLKQHPMIHDAQGRALVDFVGRFESLPRDFQKICRVIGVDAQLPHANASKRGSYRHYYSVETKRAVARIWQEDIERFGYSF